MHLAKRFMPLVLALPLAAAAAEPMRVTTTLSGLMQPNQLVLWQMGFGDIEDSGPLPFTLTLSNTLTPGGPWTQNQWTLHDDYGARMSMTLTLGDQTFSASSEQAAATIGSDGSSTYLNYVFYSQGSYDITIRTGVFGPAGSIEGNVLAPRAHDGAGFTGELYIVTSYSNPDAPGVWSTWADAEVASLNVVSAVPEPAAGGMLLAGLAVCAAALRRRRFSRQA